jgi:hypothetical protein
VLFLATNARIILSPYSPDLFPDSQLFFYQLFLIPPSEFILFLLRTSFPLFPVSRKARKEKKTQRARKKEKRK